MRRNFVARIWRRVRSLQQAVEFPQLGLQQVDLLLLAKRRAVQFLDLVLAQAELEFEFVDAGFEARSGRSRTGAGAGAPGAFPAQAKFLAAKSQLASELRKVSTNFGRALR